MKLFHSSLSKPTRSTCCEIRIRVAVGLRGSLLCSFLKPELSLTSYHDPKTEDWLLVETRSWCEKSSDDVAELLKHSFLPRHVNKRALMLVSYTSCQVSHLVASPVNTAFSQGEQSNLCWCWCQTLTHTHTHTHTERKPSFVVCLN